MANEDRTVGVKVKALLVRRGVDLSRATFAVTNGVVTIMGSLQTSQAGTKDGLDGVVQEVALARWLCRKLKRMDGVRDVNFRLSRVMNAQLGAS